MTSAIDFAVVQHGDRAELGVVGTVGAPSEHRLEVVLGEVGEPDVEVDRPAHLLDPGEDRLPVVVAQPRHAHLVRLGDEQDPVVTEGVEPLELLDRRLDIPERNALRQDEALRRG